MPTTVVGFPRLKKNFIEDPRTHVNVITLLCMAVNQWPYGMYSEVHLTYISRY